MSRRHAARPRRLDVGALVPCHQVLRGLAALLGLEVPWAFPGEARHCCLRHWFQNGAKTTDARPAPTAIVFWQRGRVHNHQARGRGKGKKKLKRREKLYVGRLQLTTVFLPLLSAGCYSNGKSPGKHHGK
jgi:hypothetical protein